MSRNLFALALAALLLAGCGKSKAEIEAEAAAVAKLQKETAAAAETARLAAGPTPEDRNRAAEIFVALACGAPQFLDEAETNVDLFEAFSGEGSDKAEARSHFIRTQNYYRSTLQQELPPRGADYKALEQYAGLLLPPQSDAPTMKHFRGLLMTSCRGMDLSHSEKVLGGVLFYCVTQAPQ